jgi:hypothetical protein
VTEGLKFVLFRFDLKTLTLEKLDSVDLDERLDCAYYELNLMDKNNFAFYRADTGDFMTGKVKKGKIVLGEILSSSTDGLGFTKLVDNKLYGLKIIESVWNLCKLDLITKKLESIKVPTILSNGEEFDFTDVRIFN